MTKNHWKQEHTEKLRPLLTLITDKIIGHGRMMGAHRNSNWATQSYYQEVHAERIQGVLDRLGKVIYYRCFHVDEKNYDFMNPKRLGLDIYDHSIRCEWREPFGKGYGPNPPECLLDSMTQDNAGNWHMPCDLGMWVTLWHPTSQRRQERVYDCWRLGQGPYWRPQYHYTDSEVKEALKIMAETFDWEYEEGDDTEYMIIH